MTNSKSIYLLGMPGCGKSTLGKQFAAHSGFTYIDTDDRIIEQQKKTIEQIYAESGEMGFRKIEHELIKNLGNTTQSIICTGGGLPCFFGNIELMNENGITVFMDVSPEEIWNRVKNTDFSGRPIYQNKSPKEIRERIETASKERKVHYEKAKLIIKSDAIELTDLLRALDSLKQN